MRKLGFIFDTIFKLRYDNRIKSKKKAYLKNWY
jgi:hypothetical protein